MALRTLRLMVALGLVVGMLAATGVTAQASGHSVALWGAPATASWNDDVAAKILGTGQVGSVDIFDASSSTPALGDLTGYDSVFVYSDIDFADGVAMGDVLADYVDAGGHLVMAVFAFWDCSGCLGIEGRIVTDGYLPFERGTQASPGGLTLVPVAPGDPLLDGVGSFDGGTSSYQNVPATLTAGSTLVADWSNGIPLVATKGSVVGLNFYPPSSDVRGDFWDASTDGAKLMANALTGGGPPPTCDGVPATIVGTAGADVIIGTVGDDVIYAGAGDDVVRGRGGDDLICGGDGDDDLRGNGGRDTIWGEAGNDFVVGGAGNDIVKGNLGDDDVRGGPGRDKLNGGPGIDTLIGNDGDDYGNGGSGDDLIKGSKGDDILRGSAGDDTIIGGDGIDTIYGDAGTDLCLLGETVFGCP